MKVLILLISLFILPFISRANPIKEGQWKGVIHYKTVDVPFTFRLETASVSTASITIINGTEEIVIENATLKNDSIFIPMYVFDAEIKAKYKDGEMYGVWHKNYKNQEGPQFSAIYNQPRFSNLTQPKKQITSDWEITFTQPSGQTSEAVGSFVNKEGNKITGTVLTEVGDFRYFEGILVGDSIKVSSFDGVHGFLMLGKYSNNSWQGIFHYDYDYAEDWSASANSKAALTDAFDVFSIEPATYKPYYDILTAGGEYDAIDTDLLDGKVVIIQLMGTWCPNSLDQTKYLSEWYKSQNKDNIELIAVTYEPGDKQYAQKRIDAYTSSLNLTYSMFIGGSLSKGQAALAFPNLNKINAFPTLVMVDKQGYIRYINSYFNGPATGKKYQAFDRAFKARVEELLSE